MEEIKYKLTKKNSILTAQAVSKLVEIIKNKFINQAKVTTECEKEIPELDFLKDKCSDSELIVSLTACQGLVYLVENGFLQIGPTLTTLIASLSSAKNCSGICYGIGKLMLYDMVVQLKTKNKYENLFGIKSPQHPMIAVLHKSSSVWLDIVNQIQSLLSHHDEKIEKNSFTLLRPVIIYILCNPNSELPEKCRTDVWNILLRFVSKNPIQNFILEILPWIQFDSSVLKMRMIIDLTETCLLQNIQAMYLGIIPLLACITNEIIAVGEDPRPCLTILSKILVETNQCDVNNHTLILLSQAVTNCPAIYLEDLIVLCLKIIKLENTNPIVNNILISSFLQWMIYPSDLLNRALDKAHSGIQLINKNKKTPKKIDFSVKIINNKCFLATQKMEYKLHETFYLVKLSEFFYNNKNKTLPNWLYRLKNSEQKFIINLLPFLFGIFINDSIDSESSELIINIFLNTIKFDNELAANILALILYKLSRSNQPKIQLMLLNSLPEFSVLKENVPMIIHTIEYLENDMQTMSISLFLKLWKTEIRCYPYLQQKLLQPTKNNVNAMELDIMKSMALREICLLRPEHHGKDIVSLLSDILNRCTDTNGGLASSFALQGITALCSAGIVDIVSTWKVLSPKLSKDKRPIVVESLCELFSEIPKLQPAALTDLNYQDLIADVISKLWSYIAISEDVQIIASAFKALSCFDIEYMTLKQIPIKFRQNLQLPSQYAKTPLDAARKPEEVLPYIPGECWIQLLQNIQESCLEFACMFLINWVRKEISQFRGGEYFVAKGKGEPLTYTGNLPHKSIIRALAMYLIQKAEKQLDTKKNVTKQCMYILSQEYDKPLPPLNWTFLHELVHVGSDERNACILITANQSITSGSAQRFIENYVTSFECTEFNEKELITLYSVLKKICKSVQPNSIREFVDNSLKYAYEKGFSKENGDKTLLKELLIFLKETLLDKNIHEANRTLLSMIIESIFDKFDADNEIFELFVDCVVELEEIYIERMTSPSVWWEINDDRIIKSILIRKKLAERKEAESPLVWFNELIDLVASHSRHQSFILKHIYEVVRQYQCEKVAFEWYLELMGRIQAVLVEKTNSEQEIEFYCDVLSIVSIALVCHDTFANTADAIVMSRETRMSLLPKATQELLLNKYLPAKASSEILNFFYHMMTNSILASNKYKNVFQDTLIAVKSDKYFRSSSIWMRCLSNIYN